MFVPKGDDLTEEWRTLHNGEIYDLQFQPDIIQLIKRRRKRLAANVAHMEGEVLVGKPKRKS
jgi:hypothetical protein